jgi:hypothetical protein
LNGAYPPGYYDLYSFDYYHGDHSYYANYPNNRVNTKRGNYERDGRTNSKEKDDKFKGKDEDKDKPPFQDEFVSLKKILQFLSLHILRYRFSSTVRVLHFYLE